MYFDSNPANKALNKVGILKYLIANVKTFVCMKMFDIGIITPRTAASKTGPNIE